MPEQVPPAVSQSFNLLLPIMIVLAVTVFLTLFSIILQVMVFKY